MLLLSTSCAQFALPYCVIPPASHFWDFSNTWESKKLREALLAGLFFDTALNPCTTSDTEKQEIISSFELRLAEGLFFVMYTEQTGREDNTSSNYSDRMHSKDIRIWF